MMINGEGYLAKYNTIIEGVWNDMNMSAPIEDEQQRLQRQQQFIECRDQIRHGTHEEFEQWFQAYQHQKTYEKPKRKRK